MYNYTLKISIFSRNALMKKLSAIPACENFTRQIDIYPVLSNDALSCADAIILDLPTSELNLHEIKANKNDDAYVVLCIDEGMLSSIAADDYALFDDIWIKSKSGSYLEMKFKRLQEYFRLKKTLQMTEIAFDTLIDNDTDLIWFKDLEGRHLKANKSFCDIVGKTKEDIKGKSHPYVWDITEDDFLLEENDCFDTEQTVLRDKKPIVSDETVLCGSGRLNLKTTKAPVFDSDGQIIGTLGIGHNVTDLQNIYAEHSLIIENIPFGMLIHNIRGEIVNVNKCFTEYFGSELEDVKGILYSKWEEENLRDIKRIDRDSIFYEGVRGPAENEHYFEIYKEPLWDSFKTIVGYLFMYIDVTSDRGYQEKILHNANTDYLTGLFNRRYMYDYLNSARREFYQLSLLYIDLDEFKEINDKHGHEVGDEVLINLADILNAHFPDGTICRLGGDEFMVITTELLSPEALEIKGNQLLNTIATFFNYKDALRGVTASVGMISDTDSSLSLDELIKRADEALYFAKMKGKNQSHFWTPSDAAALNGNG